MGTNAFLCSGLRSIDFSQNVEMIGDYALAECKLLERVTIRSSSSSNLRIGKYIFYLPSSLSVINVMPWIWPKIFASMNDDPEFIMKFFKRYHNQIFNFKDISSDRSTLQRKRRRIQKVKEEKWQGL